jgi:hypothetical protein
MPHWLVPLAPANPHWKAKKDKVYQAAGKADARLVGCWSRTDDAEGYAVVADLEEGDLAAFARDADVDAGAMRQIRPV